MEPRSPSQQQQQPHQPQVTSKRCCHNLDNDTDEETTTKKLQGVGRSAVHISSNSSRGIRNSSISSNYSDSSSFVVVHGGGGGGGSDGGGGDGDLDEDGANIFEGKHIETASMHSDDWSLLLEDFNNTTSICGSNNQSRKKTKTNHPVAAAAAAAAAATPGASSLSSSTLPPSTAADVLTSRLISYLKECINAMQQQHQQQQQQQQKISDEKAAAGTTTPTITTIPTLRVLPQRDLKSRVVQFLHGTTKYDDRTSLSSCLSGSRREGDGDGDGNGEDPEQLIMMGFKCTSSDEATWDAVRWNGFSTEKKPVPQFPTVSVSSDFNVAYSHYCMYLSKRNPLTGGSLLDLAILEETNSDFNTTRRGFPGLLTRRHHQHKVLGSSGQLPPITESGWIVATVLVKDPFTGKLPEVSTRYVPVMGQQNINGLVRLYEFPRQVLPLVRFDAARSCEDEMMLKQISGGVMGILNAFFGLKQCASMSSHQGLEESLHDGKDWNDY